MPTKYCSLCTNKCHPKSNKQKETPSLNPSHPSSADVDEENPIKNQLRVMFLLRKILEIPQSVCCTLLENCGDPCSWIDFCDACSVLLQNGKVICDQMILLQKQLKMVQNKFKKQIIQELPFEEGLFTDEKLRVKNTMRSFISHGNINHNFSSITTAAESTVLLDTLDTSNVLDPSQCVKIELDGACSNPSMLNDGDQCDSEEKEPLALDESGNQLDTHSLVNIKEELIDYQLSQRELEFNSEINSEHMTTSETNEDPEDVNAFSGQAQEEPNESSESEDSRKKTMNSRYGLRTSAFKHNKGQSPIRGKSHVSKKQHKRKIFEEVFHPSKVLVKRRKHHAVDKPSKVKFSGKSFVGNQLIRHLSSHTGKKPYKCETCGKFLSSYCNLKSHQRLHTGQRPYKCDICGKTFSQSGNLNQHKKSHTGQKPHECETCGKTFAHSGNLNQHKKRHTGEKPHKCTFCHKSFITTTDLKLHERLHTGEKPFDCKICGKSYAQSSNLKVHEKVHHGKES